MKWDKKTKEIVSYLFAAIALTVGLGLTIWGFIIDPAGQIHDSVLWVLGQSLTFVGAVCGISLHMRTTANEIKSEVLKELKDVKFATDKNC